MEMSKGCPGIVQGFNSQDISRRDIDREKTMQEEIWLAFNNTTMDYAKEGFLSHTGVFGVYDISERDSIKHE